VEQVWAAPVKQELPTLLTSRSSAKYHARQASGNEGVDLEFPGCENAVRGLFRSSFCHAYFANEASEMGAGLGTRVRRSCLEGDAIPLYELPRAQIARARVLSII